MRRSTRGVVASIAAIGLIALPSCSSSGGDDANGEKTLEILTWTYDGESLEWWETVNAKFEEENPGVKIVVEQSSSSDIRGGFLTQATAGDTATVIHVPAPLMTVRPWAEAGFLAPIGDVLDEGDLESQLAADQSAMELDGEPYGVVFAYNARMLYYNEGLLEEAGVEVPTTPQELLAAATALDGHSGGDGFGFASGDEDSLNFVNEVLTFVVGMTDGYIDGDEYNFSDPEVVKAVELWRDLSVNHSPRGTDIENKYLAFQTGNSAMMVDWTYFYESSIRGASEGVADEIRMTTPPFPHVPLHISQGFAVSAVVDEELQELGKKWLAYAVSEEAQALYASLEPVVPANIAAREVLRENPGTADVVDALADAVPITAADSLGMRATFPDFQAIFNGVMRQLLQSDRDVTEAMEDLDAQLKDAGLSPTNP